MIATSSNLEDACRQAQELINQVSRTWKDSQSQCLMAEKLSTAYKKEQSYSKHTIQSKLTRLYFEELSKVPHATPASVLKNLQNECDLLGRLVQREGLHTLIVNLYASNKGYSLGVRNSDKGSRYDKNALLSETQLMGYEQGEFLSCIDNGQLPAMLAEQLESSHSHLFYDGCIIAEVRDYRKHHTKPDIHHVLLKPTTQSVLSDVSTLTSNGEWSHEERLMLESHLVAATQGPLCLDPNPIPSLATTRIQQSKALLTDHQLMRQAKKFSQVTVNRKRKLEQLSQPEGFTIQDLMQKLKSKRGAPTTSACPTPCLANPPLFAPSTPIEVLRYAKQYERPRETKDCMPQLIEEYILETERGQGRIYHIKLSILQRPSNFEYLGELYVDRDYREGERNGSACRFTLGNRVLANQYIQQFTEIFTEEGKKNVRIKHVVPGQVPRVTCTPGMQRAHHQAQQAQLVAQQLQQAQQSQQILSRAQGQINNLAGQVASTKAAAEASTSAHVNLTCADAANVIQNIPQVDAIGSVHSVVQPIANGGPNVPAPVQIEATAMPTTNPSPCNGSGILVFQQKQTAPINNAVTNVPILQAQLQSGTQSNIGDTSQNSSEVTFKNHATNPAISALVTSLMNSANQFQHQQQVAANAAAAALNNNAQATPKSNNAAILSLLNSTPANLAQQKTQPRRISLNASIPQRVISHGNMITVPNTTGQLPTSVRLSFAQAIAGQLAGKQQPVKGATVRLARVQDSTSTLGLSMPGLSALLAGTPSADNPIPGLNSASSLLERLTASSNQGSQPTSPMTSPPPANVNLQGVNLTNLPNSINGLQNVQVSFPGLSQPITMSLNVSAATGSVTPTGVLVSLPISSGTNTCTTVSSMVPATVVTTAMAGSTPTVVIANPANTHLSLPVAQIIQPGIKSLSQQNIRNTNSVTLAQAIQLVGSQRPRFSQMARQVQPNNQTKPTVLPNQLVTVAKPVSASQLILTGNKQVLTPIMAASNPMLMASQVTPSSQSVPGNKQTLITKSLQVRTTSTGQCSPQTQGINMATLSQQQLQQLQQMAAQHKAAVAAGNSPNRTHIQHQRNSASGDDPL
ncbi:transcription factor SPT20 homolog isoform X2 [Belonocnema kinseyi]|uniref:transcription factor SPT20 homolog isoform X2 n=1 Tax=Belonocnema kinseyi TaxID=2817044 RepID=UPI00143D211F|nr:transcription factor SPT20 homolog isoform X2 [Belonocnema kinseyi]